MCRALRVITMLAAAGIVALGGKLFESEAGEPVVGPDPRVIETKTATAPLTLRLPQGRL